jgi:S-adenosylmethionine-diacylglycerol 3-amino-3-carboxypropyl transferase
MITSAGDNAFDYLLDSPNSIDCVDINPYQTSLFDLKYALFKNGLHSKLQDLFLTGSSENYLSIFKDIEPYLRNDSINYWNTRKKWFSHDKGFYTQGLTGKFAKILNFLIDTKGLKSSINALVYEKDFNTRKEIFENKIEPVLWKGFSKHFWKSDLILGLAGIPKTQSSGMVDLNEYMRKTLYNLFVNQGAHDNYFWRIYLEGFYSKNCCPNYLKEEHFKIISSQLHKLSHSTSTVTEFLNLSEKKYSHFVLLDHQDWLIGNETDQLEKEWIAILKSAKPTAKVLFRSVHKSLEFLPDFVKSKVKELPIDKNYLLENDRVGTYPSTYLLEIHV